MDAIRDVDTQFGRLMEGLKGMAYYRDATIILYSDHGHNNHLFQEDLGKSTDVVQILYEKGLITEDEKAGKGFGVMGLSSMAAAYWMADTLEERREKARAAKEVLLRHEIINPETGIRECPWDLMSHEDMITGVPGVAEPGELWHNYFGPGNDPQSLLWPDLILAMRNGWQAPLSPDLLVNLGIILPFSLPPVTLFLGGHGGPDTQRIVMAMSGPGIARGKVLTDPDYEKNHRIADLAVTVAERCGLRLGSTTVGQDRSKELT